MLDIKFIRENLDRVRSACKNKRVDCDIDRLLEVDGKRRELIGKIDELRAEQKKVSVILKEPKATEESREEQDNGKSTRSFAGAQDDKINQAKEIKNKIKELEPELVNTEKEFKELIYLVPNITLDDVPVGKDESENQVIRKWGDVPKFDFKPKDHVELGEKLDIIDIKRATKVSGARFAYFKNEAALLESALIQYVFETLTSKKIVKKIADSVQKGYSVKTFIPVFPPMMILPEVFEKMARLSEADKDDKYYLDKDDMYLVGSAEHTLGSMHMNETFGEDDLPIRYIGFSSSFRREAGSYGKDTKGILRVHQFDKLEMESFTLPENSLLEHKFFVAIQEYLIQSLKISYQVVMICTGDMGAPDARQVDMEAWIPSQNKYRETHTADLMTDYQARRLNTKVKRKDKTELVHMNDATAFAIGRILIAILENYQQKDGSVKIPKVLQKYMGGIKKIG